MQTTGFRSRRGLRQAQSVVGLDLKVNDAIVDSGSILVGGQVHGENVVWQLSIDMVSP